MLTFEHNFSDRFDFAVDDARPNDTTAGETAWDRIGDSAIVLPLPRPNDRNSKERVSAVAVELRSERLDIEPSEKRKRDDYHDNDGENPKG